MGVDTPDDVARKLNVPGPPGACPKKGNDQKLTPAEKATQKFRSVLCWNQVPLKEPANVEAKFYDYGAGPVIYDLAITFPISVWSWLPGFVEAQLGPADSTDDVWRTSMWSWTHTEVRVGKSECERDNAPTGCKSADIMITHWPTLALSIAGVTQRAGSLADRSKVPTPLELRFGNDDGSKVEQKLVAAGFRLSIVGCNDPYPRARGIAVRRCSMTGGNLVGLRSDTVVEIVDGGAGPRLAALTYNFSPSAYDATVRQLTELYGAPLEQKPLGPSWSIGGIEVAISKIGEWFTLEYSHGRLKQLSYKAMYLDSAAEKDANKRAL